MILRWYWWRVNAWSEISALAASAIVSNLVIVSNVFDKDHNPNATADTLLVTVPVTTLVWVVVTFLTKPESEETLLRFFERVRPSTTGWRRVARVAKPAAQGESLGINVLDWFAGCGLVYGALFGIGKVIFGALGEGIAYLALASVCGAIIAYNVYRTRAPITSS